MSINHVRRIATVGATFALAALIATGCGQSGNDDDGDNGGSEADGPKVGLVTDIGGLNDRSFNFLANEGLEQAKDELGASGTVIESKSDSDYGRNLGSQVTNGSELVVGIGFLMADAIKDAAEKAPDTNFAIIDNSYAGEDGEWTATDNVVGLVFNEQEAGYLAGVLAGAVEEAGELEGLNDQKVVSAIGGQEIPPVVKYIAGFKAGVLSQCEDCEVLVDYSQDFIAQEKCQDRALAQIARGSDIVFQVAGQCGLGALDAAKQRSVWGIGVDADQAHLGSHILTSAVKRVDQAVFQTIENIKDGDFEGGKDIIFGLEDDGVGLGEINEAASEFQDLIDETTDGIVSGDIEVPITL
ncbi:MAG: family transporter substrate-binding protein [Thermoleophilia bacterium]|jgi:basic membrane protein A|nr:family transporter substrate-binding protein [Thermoleophilia bacterium]